MSHNPVGVGINRAPGPKVAEYGNLGLRDARMRSLDWPFSLGACLQLLIKDACGEKTSPQASIVFDHFPPRKSPKLSIAESRLERILQSKLNCSHRHTGIDEVLLPERWRSPDISEKQLMYRNPKILVVEQIEDLGSELDFMSLP